jgi:hypothetical protein
VIWQLRIVSFLQGLWRFGRNPATSRIALMLLGMAGIAGANTTPGSIALAWNRNPEIDVAGYRIYWGEVSRVYTEMRDTGSSPGGLVDNLNPGTPYYCAVTAYNAAGQESAFSAEITVTYGTAPVVPDSAARLVLLEAEAGELGPPMGVFGGATESWVDTTQYSQSGWTRLAFEVPASGDYHVWCRVKAPAESSDSFFVMADSGTEEVFHVYGTPLPPAGSRRDEWIWRRIQVTDGGPRVYPFGEGSHALRFRVREPGTLLDRVVLSSDPAFVPTDDLPGSGDTVVVTGITPDASVQPGGSVTLAVSAVATGPVAYQWFKDGVAIPDAREPSLRIDPVREGDGGSYRVLLTRGAAVVEAGPVQLTVGEPPFHVTGFTVNSDQSVSFEIEGGRGANLVIQASDDLITWSSIGSRVNETGVIEVVDPARAGAAKRFYRLVREAAAMPGSAGAEPEPP